AGQRLGHLRAPLALVPVLAEEVADQSTHAGLAGHASTVRPRSDAAGSGGVVAGAVAAPAAAAAAPTAAAAAVVAHHLRREARRGDLRGAAALDRLVAVDV